MIDASKDRRGFSGDRKSHDEEDGEADGGAVAGEVFMMLYLHAGDLSQIVGA